MAPQRCAFFSSTAVRAADTAALVMEALAVPAGALTRSEQLLELDQVGAGRVLVLVGWGEW